ncbi:hypothetical protein [Kitasatospora sp. LaBMicrA B282]|uniref:hypothetical protein n=1 Tax=Kitasatospora sp. LaBMicrA B282 TaxID=3420949 RepID=UPI003D110372
MNRPHRRAAAALAELSAALEGAGLPVEPLDDGWLVTEHGELLVRVRPLHPIEIRLLARAIRPRPVDDGTP